MAVVQRRVFQRRCACTWLERRRVYELDVYIYIARNVYYTGLYKHGTIVKSNEHGNGATDGYVYTRVKGARLC